MSMSIYAALSRQSGLMKEMDVVANNIANSATTGFRAEGTIFSEFIRDTGTDAPSVSMAYAGARQTSWEQGGLTRTGGSFDVAIEGEGFFQIETPQGPRLTRFGAFIPTPEGQLVTPEGYPLLDVGGAPVFAPAEAESIGIAADGTISADGDPIGQIGVVVPQDPALLYREDGVRFRADTPLDPAEDAAVVQGFLESSNVDPVSEMTRMIEVQRAYEMGQSFLEREDERLRSVLTLAGR